MKFFILLLLSVNFLSAKSVNPRELADLAQERAPLIKIFLEQESMGQSQLKQSHILANPILTYQGGRLKSGTQSGQVTDLTLMQPVPWPGKRSALIKSHEFLSRISQMDVAEAKLSLGHRVYILAYELASEVEIEKHNKERKERFSLIAKYLSSRPLASPKQQLDRDIIESQIRLVEKLMNQVTARKNGLREELRLLTGLDDLEINVDWEKLPNAHPRDFYASNIGEGWRLKKIDQSVKLSENRIEEARLQARPDIMVGVNYRQENVAPTNHFYHGQVAVVIPIVDRGQHSVQTARAQLRREEASMKLALQETNTELAYSYESLLAAKNGVSLFPMNLRRKSEVRFQRAEDAFRKGQIDVMTFLQSDTQVHENIDLIYTSRLEYLTAVSRLEQLVGHYLEEK
ncbi:TolC family protein [Peredibacter starrii]|uniref:TolC family protein n=1 Tax=Peredibacter starrii TaxID=28202 RepID=A0AAX4HU61_9BACT|nr:TolC family protein [Peredibacter starrii]WPU66725.1 TolC family protein [Peredibacter starrii]